MGYTSDPQDPPWDRVTSVYFLISYIMEGNIDGIAHNGIALGALFLDQF